MVKEYKPKLNEIQVTRKNLTSLQNTKNHMGLKAKEKFNGLDTEYKNGQNLRTGNNPSPIPSLGNNKQGYGR